MAGSLVALRWDDLGPGMLVAILLMVLLWVPYLLKEIRDGKRELGPLRRLDRRGVTLGPATPIGAGDINPGRKSDPAPGQPDGQSEPYGERAQRDGPPIRS